MLRRSVLGSLLVLAACTGRIDGDPLNPGNAGDDDAGGSVPPDARAAADAPRGDPADPIDGAPDSDAPSAAGCATPGLLFCDDFESYALGEARSSAWTPETQSGTLTIDDTQARGARALHVQTENNGRAVIRVANLAPADNSFFGRMYVFVTAFPSAPDFAHFTLVEAAGVGAGLVRPIGGQYVPPSVPDAGRSLWGVGSDQGPTGDWTSWKTTAPAESGRWLCLEWEMRAADNAIDVWIDGVAHPELSVSTRSNHGGVNANIDFVFPRFDRITFGWQLYQGGSTPREFDLWFDDIALGPSRLGC